ncbi:MAG: xanthine dehydrogenase family protein molybdopterin-binding subunit [Pseudomonadota bacterium]
MTLITSRRGFLAASGTALGAGAVLTVGFSTKGLLAAGTQDVVFNPFVSIAEDGTVTVVVKHFEMGQGTSTGLPTLVAEELDADWDQIAVTFAPSDNARYANLAFGAQGTGGSTAIANSFMQYRQAGAAARAVLVEAAAKTWGLDPAEISVEKGVISGGGKSAGLGDFALAASSLTPPQEPLLKSPEAFTLIGKADLPRKDSRAKTDGSAIFATDLHLPGMVTAVILRAPRFGATLTSFDASGAEGQSGYLGAQALTTGTGVAVFGKDTWSAIQARQAITAEWDFSQAENRDTAQILADHQALLENPQFQTRAEADQQTSEAALAGAAQVVEAEFHFPNLAHTPMEPLCCVIAPTDQGVKIYDGAQFQAITHPTVAAVLGLPPSAVEIETVYAGGSFGRRATPNSDYQAEAAMAFALLGRKTPVKLAWTREDDLTGGYYRPLAVHRAKIGLDGEGAIAGWDHRLAVKPILKGTPFESMLVHNGIDHSSIEGLSDTFYGLPAFSVGLSDGESQVPVLWWRAVGHTHTAYAMEVSLDMAAEAGGQDPVDLRLALLQGEDKDRQRLRGVLQLAAKAADWGTPLPEGKGRGIAVHKSFGSYVAIVAEVARDGDEVAIERIVCAVDCGLAVNPDVIKAQMEGGIGYGISAALREEITLAGGEVEQLNFPDYEILRMGTIGTIEVHIQPSTEAPTGVGEPGLPPSAPALANAIRAAGGPRITVLPMTKSGLFFS